MKRRLEEIETKIELLLFQLGEYHNYVSSEDIQYGYPSPDDMKEQLRKLNRDRIELLRKDF